jgi:3-dehydroquinate synthase
MQNLLVELGERSYPILIGTDLFDRSEALHAFVKGRQVLVVSNTTVAPLYLERLLAGLHDFVVATVILPDGEQYKDLDHLNLIFTALLEQRFSRNCTLIALGGGVVGDMTGFAAATYQRGVRFIQVPTTLLAQVDSSVGGKTGVNHALGKNMIGAFKQPQAVLADTDVLKTLPERELAAGLAEVIKYGLIRDLPFLGWIEANMDRLLARDPDALGEAVYRSCQNKAAVVSADELENDQRAILNLGHTFGHAIETGMGYGQWLHGEAVATGMLMAADLSWRMGWISRDDVQRVRSILLAAGLPVEPPASISPEQFLSLMAVDKKNVDGRLRLVLLKGMGNAVMTDSASPSLLQQTLRAGSALGEAD